MKEGFRQSMAWLHTWTGLVVGWVLFFVFLTGTAGYVQIELTRWMQPEQPLPSKVLVSEQEQINQAYDYLRKYPDAQNAERWGVNLQTNQRGADAFAVNWTSPPKEEGQRGQYHKEVLDVSSGQPITAQIKPRETGGGFTLYRMHYALHYIPYDWGIRIVGMCTMFMFVAIISGIITHKKIFKDFFTFRPAKGQRSWLDAHNVISVIALPFYLMITYSGLIFFANAYMPLGVPMVYGAGEKNTDRYYAELYPNFRNNDQATVPPSMGAMKQKFTPIQPLLAKVQKEWGGTDKVSQVNFYSERGGNPAKIEFYQTGSDSIARKRTSLSFDLYTGQKIVQEKSNEDKAPMVFGTTVLGLHEGLFASSFIRILYVLTGFLGTAMIATGLVLWTVKRRPKQLKLNRMSFGHALVERLNIAMIAGLPLAIAVYFWANRLIPFDFSNRANWEVHCLYITLLLSFIYALSRPIVRAWIEILAFTALAYLLLPILNFITTDRHLGVLLRHQDFALASIDLGFIFLGIVFAWASYRVWSKRDSILKPMVKKSAKPRVSQSNHVNALSSSEELL